MTQGSPRIGADHLLDAPGLVAVVLSESGEILAFGRGAETVTGRAAADVLGANLFETLTDAAGREALVAAIARVRQSASAESTEARLKHRDGDTRHVSWGVAPMDGDRRVLALGCDITAYRDAETALDHRARQQAAVATLAREAVHTSDTDALLAQAAHAVRDTLGGDRAGVFMATRDPERLKLRAGAGWPLSDDGSVEVDAAASSPIQRALLSSKPQVLDENAARELPEEVRSGSGAALVAIPGREEPVGLLLLSGVPSLSQEQADFLQTVAHIAADTVARHRAEQWRHSLISTTQDAVVSIDRAGRIVEFNPAAERVFRYQRSEVIGRKVNVLMAEPYATEHDGYIQRYEHTREPHAIGRIRIVTARRSDGELFPIELSVTEVVVDSEVRYGAFIRDISEKVEMQRRLLEGERLAAIGTTAAKFAHEIGNPLNGMYMNAQLMQRRLAKTPDSDPRLDKSLQVMMGEIKNLTRLLQEFRSLSRRQKFQFTPLAVDQLIHGLLDAEQAGYEAQGVAVAREVAADLPEVRADGAKLAQVLRNLCKNAVEAMKPRGTLTVQAVVDDEAVVVRIHDTGCGIPDDVDVFEPFATTKDEGTGLGLPVVQQILRAHGGRVSYAARPGGGTIFSVRIPREPPAPSES